MPYRHSHFIKTVEDLYEVGWHMGRGKGLASRRELCAGLIGWPLTAALIPPFLCTSVTPMQALVQSGVALKFGIAFNEASGDPNNTDMPGGCWGLLRSLL